jgi:hypothetical protein
MLLGALRRRSQNVTLSALEKDAPGLGALPPAFCGHGIPLDEKGAIVLRENVSRGRIAARLVNVPQCLIGIEAGMATHYVARKLLVLGQEVKQVLAAPGRR